MARNRNRNRSVFFWIVLGYFTLFTSTLILKFLSPKDIGSVSDMQQGTPDLSVNDVSQSTSGRGIVASEVVDKVLSWVFDEDPPRCPSCRALLATKPKRKTICPFCGKAIYVRTNSSGYTELLNEGHLRFYKR